MNRSLFSLALAATVLLFVAGCKQDGPNPDKKGEIVLNFDNVVGSADLALNTGSYTNASGEDFTVTMLNYYISNIVLTNAEGGEYVVPQDKSYFLVKEEDAASQMITLTDVPEADYTGVKFIIGVDSARCAADLSARTGVLDPASGGVGMYWSWNSGYIFLKIEGTSSAAPADPSGNKAFRYHVGGFGGYSSATINNIKEVSLDFGGEEAMVREDHGTEVHIHADVLKVFTGHMDISIASNHTVHFSPFSTNIAENYKHMFSVDHVHNDDHE